MPTAFLPNRVLLHVTGADAENFLQGLITTDLDALPQGEARPGALLTPQGKIFFTFMIWRTDSGLALETDQDQGDALIKRLSMYKLRAAVDIAAGEPDGVTVLWGDEMPTEGIADFRFAKAGVALFRRPGHHGDGPADDYHALRIHNGIAVAPLDYALQDAFPHDVLMDLNGGLSFKKGCYIGQEVISRMHHRGTARRRVVIVHGDTDLPASGTEIHIGAKPAGELGTVIGRTGLAIVRIDRVGEAIADGAPIVAGDVNLVLTLPAWSGLSFPGSGDEAQS